MPSLLVELFSEEIPAGMQLRAAQDLGRMIISELVNNGLSYKETHFYVTPRRLALIVSGVPGEIPVVFEERKGPRVGSGEDAISGFIKSSGLSSISEAEVVSDDKGAFYIARKKRPSCETVKLIKEFIPKVITSFPWPKSQRWGDSSLRWIRPLRSILVMFGGDGSKHEVVPFSLHGLVSGNVTYGHRFLCPGEILLDNINDYLHKLQHAKVLPDREHRKEVIFTGAIRLACSQDAELIRDDELLDEVTGLVEWPVVLLGAFDESFLSLPREIITAAIRVHQKCFVLNDAKTGLLTNRFVIVSNLEAIDGGLAIVEGYNRVVNARLADAKYSYDLDMKPMPEYEHIAPKLLDQKMEKLKNTNVVFYSKLGSQFQRVSRIVRLARRIAKDVGADAEKAARAAYLAKADLVTAVVSDFPELQGVIGGYYAKDEDPVVANAIVEHYKPLSSNDDVSREPTAVAVAIADKVDTLVGFWLINEKPTGSKDPYQLRRSALGVIRSILENRISLDLYAIAQAHADEFGFSLYQGVIEDLMRFFYGRLERYLGKLGIHQSIVKAVLCVDQSTEFLSLVDKIVGLQSFLSTDYADDLFSWYKRVDNLLKPERCDGENFPVPVVDVAKLVMDEEIALYNAIKKVQLNQDVASYRELLISLAELNGVVGSFFQSVLVNVPEADVRLNRLGLLTSLYATANRVAAFSMIVHRS